MAACNLPTGLKASLVQKLIEKYEAHTKLNKAQAELFIAMIHYNKNVKETIDKGLTYRPSTHIDAPPYTNKELKTFVSFYKVREASIEEMQRRFIDWDWLRIRNSLPLMHIQLNEAIVKFAQGTFEVRKHLRDLALVECGNTLICGFEYQPSDDRKPLVFDSWQAIKGISSFRWNARDIYGLSLGTMCNQDLHESKKAFEKDPAAHDAVIKAMLGEVVNNHNK